jgi:membrane protein
MRAWRKARVGALAASLAYFTLFAFVPIIWLLLVLIDPFFVRGVVDTVLVDFFATTLSDDARYVVSLLRQLESQVRQLVPALVSLVLAVLAGVRLLTHLRGALHQIWGVGLTYDRRSSWRRRLWMGFLLLVFLFIAAAIFVGLAFMQAWRLHVGVAVDSKVLTSLLQLLSIWALGTIFCVLAFGFLSGVVVDVPYLLLGSLGTSLFITIGQLVMPLVLLGSRGAGVFGAGAGVVIVLLWLYYSWYVFLLGATLTKVMGDKYRS